jgi:hypothetical protein
VVGITAGSREVPGEKWPVTRYNSNNITIIIIIIIIQFHIINVLTQQPESQLQKQHRNIKENTFKNSPPT